MTNKTGGPAFPGKQAQVAIPTELRDKAHQIDVECNGMTLRDYFAAHAMRGIVMHMNSENWDEIAAKWCYTMADAMLKEREK
jgi:hypothetical protein